MKLFTYIQQKSKQGIMLICGLLLMAQAGFAQDPTCGNPDFDLACGYIIERNPSFQRQLKIDGLVPTNVQVVWWELLPAQFGQIDNAAFKREFYNNRIGNNVATPGLEWRYKFEALAKYADTVRFLINGLYVQADQAPFYDLEAALRKGRDNAWAEEHLTASELFYLYDNQDLAEKTVLYLNVYNEDGSFDRLTRLSQKLTDTNISTDTNLPPSNGNVLPGLPPPVIANTPAVVLPLRKADSITFYITDRDSTVLNEVHHFELYAVLPTVGNQGNEYPEEKLVNPKDGKPYFTTNQLGSVTIPATYLKQGQQLKVRKLMQRFTVKDPSGNGRDITEFDNIFRLFIQNHNYSIDGQSMSFDNAHLLNIQLDRTEIGYNYYVVVEWDADAAFLESLKETMYGLGNHVYDYTDGHLRFDTVVIKDNGQNMEWANMVIFANNQEHPRAHRSGIENRNYFNQISSALRVYQPRKDWGNQGFSLQLQRNQSVLEPYPYNLAVSTNFRTMGHENGHYIVGLFDEYLAANKTVISPRPERFGLMELQHALGSIHQNGIPGSEMSNAQVYVGYGGPNTYQRAQLGGSCWEFFEAERQLVYKDTLSTAGPNSNKDIRAEILNPLERTAKPQNLHYYPGPFIDQKSRVFVDIHDQNTGATNRYMEVAVQQSTGAAPVVGNANVQITRVSNFQQIDQGNTSDANLPNRSGQVQLLGIANNDVINGWITIPNDAHYTGQMTFNAGMADGFRLTLKKVQGLPTPVQRFAMAGQRQAGLQNEAQDTVFRFIATTSLAGASLQVSVADNSGFVNYNSIQDLKTQGTYIFSNNTAQVPVSVLNGGEGLLAIRGTDATNEDFAVFAEFNHYGNINTVPTSRYYSANGLFTYAAANDQAAGIDQLVIVNYSINLPKEGLPYNALPVSDAYSISADATGNVAGAVEITYDEARLDETQASSLSLYRWNSSTNAWELADGTIIIDPARNIVSAGISQLGTYALFYWDGSVAPPPPVGGRVNIEAVSTSPNPFTEQVTTSFELEQEAVLSIGLYNNMGHKIKDLQPYTRMQAGKYAVDLEGTGLKPGTYFIVFQFENEERIIKRVLKVE